MISVSDSALKELDAYFQDKDLVPIRIYLAPGGCSGPRLSLALDEKRDGDEELVSGKYTFLIETALLQDAKPIGVDMGAMGFTITSSLQLGGGSCSSGGGNGGCSSGCGSCCS